MDINKRYMPCFPLSFSKLKINETAQSGLVEAALERTGAMAELNPTATHGVRNADGKVVFFCSF